MRKGYLRNIMEDNEAKKSTCPFSAVPSTIPGTRKLNCNLKDHSIVGVVMQSIFAGAVLSFLKEVGIAASVI